MLGIKWHQKHQFHCWQPLSHVLWFTRGSCLEFKNIQMAYLRRKDNLSNREWALHLHTSNQWRQARMKMSHNQLRRCPLLNLESCYEILWNYLGKPKFQSQMPRRPLWLSVKKVQTEKIQRRLKYSHCEEMVFWYCCYEAYCCSHYHEGTDRCSQSYEFLAPSVHLDELCALSLNS